MPAKKNLKKLESYAEMLQDVDKEIRKALISVLNEEEALSRVGTGTNDAALRRKYSMDSMTGDVNAK
jgi:hypothetical protein